MVAEYKPVRFRLQLKRENPRYSSPPFWTNPPYIMSDDQGNVVYAAAHNPYGGMQQTWVNTFNPELKFSGKEQDAESGLYYFGARYYDPTCYRFLSPDPVIQPKLGMANPQFWNLYSYCGNNPLRYFDTDGRSFLIFIACAELLFVFDKNGNLMGVFPASNNPVKGARNYPEGLWHYTHYNQDEKLPTGFFGFDVPSKSPGSMGLHAGRSSWKYPTRGCIRTTEEAMALIKKLHFNGDPVRFLIVTWDDYSDGNGNIDINGIISKIDYLLKFSNLDESIKNKVKDAVERYLDLYLGPLNFLFDYFLNSESPIPPNAG